MKYWVIILSLLSAGLVLAETYEETPISAQAKDGPRPNIVFILADDLGWRDVGFNGTKFYETPNIDRLSEGGMRFNRAYTGGPNCLPTRACLISGMYTPRTQIWTPGGRSKGKLSYMKLKVPCRSRQWETFPSKTELEPSVISIAEVLKTAGYKTARFGKWHVGADTQGFDISDSNGKGAGPDGKWYGNIDVHEWLTDAGVKFIEDNKDGPFMLYLSHWDVHTPIRARKEAVAPFEEKLKNGEWERKWNTTYAGMIHAVDQSVKRVHAKLVELGLDENTVFIFSSDNGGYAGVTSNKPLKGAKGALYEGGVRVPTFVSWPKVIAAGSVCETPVTSVDFMPTFAELTGASLPTEQPVDGVSIVPLMKGEKLKERSIFWHYPLYLQGRDEGKVLPIAGTDDLYWRATPASMIMKGDWKLINFFEDNSFKLYNVADEISEPRDLAADNPDIAKALTAELKEWQKDTKAVIPTVLNEEFAVAGQTTQTPTLAKQQDTKNKPNVIYILADDLGYGDLSIMGQKKLKTPHIDRLGTEGIIFSDHYSGNTVCSPSRANLMTGQHPGHVACRSNGTPMAQKHLDPEMVTLPRLFKNAGYATGAFGKWGLGTTCEEGRANPMTHGFDTFSGWKSQVIAHTYYPTSIVRDGKEEKLEEGTFIHDLLMDDALAFIKKSAQSGKPFFAYIPTAVPHAAMHAPKDLHDKWRKVFPEFESKVGKYGAGRGEKCPPVTNPIAGFAAMIENLDNQVGDILDLLKELGVDDNTVVMFASDNGPHKEGGHSPVFWDSNGPLRGIKRDYYDGGIRSPFLARWPGKIKAGRKSAHISAFWDVLATMADLTGQQEPKQSDGISMLPTLIGKTDSQKKHEYLYWEDSVGESIRKRAIREGDWKGVQKYRNGKPEAMELFNLRKDIGEEADISAKHPEIVERLEKMMSEAHRPAATGDKLR